jgi:predicted metal-dependent enzyme (double-stranded beta helix superfamily)
MTMIEVEGSKQNEALCVLADEIRHACAGCTDDIPYALRRALRSAIAQPTFLSAAQRVGRADSYARHLLYADDAGRFSVVAIVWGAGQFSPVHGHHTWCSYAVVAGVLQEECYAWSADCRAVRLQERRTRCVGDITFTYAGIQEAHRLGNPGGEDAVSIHVYGIDSPRVATHVNRLVQAVL